MKSKLEEKALNRIAYAGLPVPEREYIFCPGRKFRFDFAWPEIKLALEIEGGIWNFGRHNRPAGFVKDLEKYNLAILQGWRVLRYTNDTLDSMLVDVQQAMALSTCSSKED